MRKFLVDIAIPIYNEEKIIVKNVDELIKYARKNFKFKYKVTLLTNGCVDKSVELSKNMSEKYDEVFVVNLKKKGRGNALKSLWLSSKANVVGYMDADLSTNLKYVNLAMKGLMGCDGVVGTRNTGKTEVFRSRHRNALSTTYRYISQKVLGVEYSDLQCGFKFFKLEKIRSLLHIVENENWFFDTELVFMCVKNGLRLKELPVDWKERRGGKVRVISTVLENIFGLYRISRANS